jgi:hypothetical protein
LVASHISGSQEQELPMKDKFSGFTHGLTAPLSDGFDIMPDDTEELSEVTRAIYVGQGGDVAIELAGGGSVVLKGLKPGIIYPLRLARVLATGTTASDLVGMV